MKALCMIAVAMLFAACSKAPEAVPSVSGTWQILGKESSQDEMDIEDQNGTITGYMTLSGEHYLVAGTRLGKKFDLTGETQKNPAAIHFDGILEPVTANGSPQVISGSYFLTNQPELKMLWRAQWNTRTLAGAEIYRTNHKINEDYRAAMAKLR